MSAPSIAPRARRAIGLALVACPALVLIPFHLLGTTFDYPDILRRPAPEVLTRLAAGGDGLVLMWYAYAACLIPFLVAVIALPDALPSSPLRQRLMRSLGALAAITQLVGLLRWSLVAPALASAYVDPSATDATRQAIAVAFDVQHRLFGNLLGEHVGQLALGLWTLLVAGTQPSRALRALGRAAGGLFLLGLGAGLATTVTVPAAAVLERAPMVAFFAWTPWMIATGVRLVWPSAGSPERRAAPATTSAAPSV